MSLRKSPAQRASQNNNAGNPPAPTPSDAAQPASVQPSAPTSNHGYQARKLLPPKTTNEVNLVILLGEVNRGNGPIKEFITLIENNNGKEFLVYGKDKPFSIPTYLVHKLCAGQISSLTGSNKKSGIHIKLINKYIRFFSKSEKTNHGQLTGYVISNDPTAYTEPKVNTTILLTTRDGVTKTSKTQFISIAPNPKNFHEHAELILSNVAMTVTNKRKNRKETIVEQLTTPAVEIDNQVIASRDDTDIICNFDLSSKCTPYYEITYTP